MDKMAQIIPVVQSWAIPVLCVIMVIAALNMMKQPGKTQVTDENNFKVTENSFWLVLAGFTVLIAAILIWMGVTHDNAGQAIATYIMAGLCVAAAIAFAYVYFKKNLTVEGDTLTYQPIWGKKVTCVAKTVGKIERLESSRGESFKFYNRSGKLLFEIQGYMVNSKALLKHMKKYPVKITRIEADASNK